MCDRHKEIKSERGAIPVAVVSHRARPVYHVGVAAANRCVDTDWPTLHIAILGAKRALMRDPDLFCR